MTEPSKSEGPIKPANAPAFPTDTSALSTVYTNFCHASVTPEELVLDFGLNPHWGPSPAEPIKLTHRVVMNFFTAKRLAMVLNSVLSQHESAFGQLELDIQKRMKNPPRPGTQPMTGIRPAP